MWNLPEAEDLAPRGGLVAAVATALQPARSALDPHRIEGDSHEPEPVVEAWRLHR